MLALFIKGFIIGLAIAAPVGPIGILCIQRSLHNGFKIGLISGLGAALADGIYGLIAGFGLTTLTAFLMAQQHWIRWLGGLFLLYLGCKLFWTVPKPQQSLPNNIYSSWRALASTFLFTLANPATILSFVAILASLSVSTAGQNYEFALILVAGIVLGSTSWWLMLSGLVAFILHKRLSPKILQNINRISGTIIFMFGLIALITRS